MKRRCRWKPRISTIIAALAGLASLVTLGLSQTFPISAQLTAGPSYSSGDGKSLPEFPKVDLVFDLRGRDGNPILPRPSDLKLYSQGQEIGRASSIRSFGQTGYGIAAILALDVNSFIGGEPLNNLYPSMTKFVNQARPQDKVAVLRLADQIQVCVPFGAGQTSLADGLPTVTAHAEFTRLYDDLIDALALFTNNQPKRRQLLVISDGHDEGSNHTMTEVILRAKSLGVVIDSIGLANDRGQYLVSMQQLSFETGGIYVRAQSAQQLEALIGQDIQAKRATPVAAFTLDNVVADGKLLSTQLRWQPGNLSATAFIQAPKRKFPPNLISYFSNLWIWGLGGCFVAGIILLVLSWGSSQSGPAPTSAAAADHHNPAPRAGISTSSARLSPGIDECVSVGPSHSPAVRTLTLIEEAFIAQELASASKIPRPPQRAQKESDTPRSKNEFAVYFNAPASGPFARLLVKNGSLAGQTIPITATKFSLGAVQGNSLLLPGDQTISGQHARFHWENSMLHIEDNNSTNGTYLNRLRLSPGRHPLKPGDEVGIGQTIIIVEHA